MTEEWIQIKYHGPHVEVWKWVEDNFEKGHYFRVGWAQVVEFDREEDAMLFKLRWA